MPPDSVEELLGLLVGDDTVLQPVKQVMIELLAHHAVRAELWGRAAPYLYQAGEKAYAQARYHAGADFYQATVEALDRLGDAADPPLKLDACLELWSARSTIGQHDGLRELGEQAEALARALDDGPREVLRGLRPVVRRARRGSVSDVRAGPQLHDHAVHAGVADLTAVPLRFLSAYRLMMIDRAGITILLVEQNADREMQAADLERRQEW